MKSLDLTGKVYGMLTGIAPTGKDAWGTIRWKFKCACGNNFESAPGNVFRSPKASCGCIAKEVHRNAVILHGETDFREYKIWTDMNARCSIPSSTNWKYYGAKGITVCARWQGSEGYMNFISDLGRPPTATSSIERIDFTKGYSSENCKWIEKSLQMRNTARTWRAPDGTPVIDLAERAGLPMSTVSQRVHKLGWTLEKALSAPKFHNGVNAIVSRPHSRAKNRVAPELVKAIDGLFEGLEKK
jgi:hypothetical protein